METHEEVGAGHRANGASPSGKQDSSVNFLPDKHGAQGHDKAFSTVQARAALAGFQLRRNDSVTGLVGEYLISRWNLSKTFAALIDVERFIDQVGGHHAR